MRAHTGQVPDRNARRASLELHADGVGRKPGLGLNRRQDEGHCWNAIAVKQTDGGRAGLVFLIPVGYFWISDDPHFMSIVALLLVPSSLTGLAQASSLSAAY